MPRLSVAVLGAPFVRHGGRLLTFPTRKALALLVFLTVEGGLHPRDKLAALFWPDSGQESGRATLRSTLARLRAALAVSLDEPHLIVERDVVGFDIASDFALDLHDLEAAYGLARGPDGEPPAGQTRKTLVAKLERGAASWRGEFLEGFSLRDAPDFDDWTGLQREVWRRRTETVLDHLSRLHGDAGATACAIETVDRWLRLDPLAERAHRRLMQLHLAAGDRIAALRAYESCRSLLDKELGVAPEPETEALADRLRAAPAPAGASRRAVGPETSWSGVALLVGREDEFTTLVERYHAASRGRPQAVVLLGEAGIGKTRLAAEFLGWAAAQGADVLQGRAFEAGARLPYQPLIDALRPRLEREAKPETLVGDVWLVELSRLLPELRERRPDLPHPAGTENAARARLFEALARVGRALANRAPLVLLIDDVQWGDAASLDVVRYAARRWTQDETGVLVLLCLRSEALATTPALDDWLLGLDRDLALSRLELAPLSFDDTMRLLRGLESEPAVDVEEFARWLFAETSGQPFFLVETLRTLLDRGALAPRRDAGGAWGIDIVRTPRRNAWRGLLPPGVRRVIQARLAPLAPTARDLLVAGAVLGQGFTFELLCRVGQLAVDDALAALDEVRRGHLLRESAAVEGGPGDGRYTFGHDKIRDVVYAEAGEARRRVFHRRALETLEADSAPAAELARHALAARLDEPALHFSAAAGDAAMRLLAARDAAAHYEQAIVLAERLGRADLVAELRARRGHAFVGAAMSAEARRELETALADTGSRNPERRAEILLDSAEADWWLLDVAALRRHAGEALDLAAGSGRGDLEAKAIAWLGAAEGSEGNLTACVEQNRRAASLARVLGMPPHSISQGQGALALYWLGRLDEAVALSRKAVATARKANDIPWTMLSLPNFGLALAASGRYAEAAQVFDEVRQTGREFGVGNLLARAISMSAGFHLDLGDLAGAEAIAEEARDLARSLDFPPPAVSAGIDLLFVYARRGEVARAEALIDGVVAVSERAAGFHGWLWRIRLAQARAEIALARGDWAETLRSAAAAGAQSRTSGRVKYEVLALTTRARALVALGRQREATARLKTAIALARPIGDPALLLHAVGVLLAVDGDDALAVEAGLAFERIAAALPGAEMRQRFEAAGPNRLLVARAR